MRALHQDQSIAWTGIFKCEFCSGAGRVKDQFGEVECATCDGDGSRELNCMLHFDILPGEPPSGLSGPPEFSDPGCGPEITKIMAKIDGVDKTALLENIEAADEFICDKWEAPEPDRSDEPDYEDEDHG